jgi:hypothetical protein
MNLDQVTLGEIKSLQSLLKCEPDINHPFKIGENYFIRTVTHHYSGKLVKVFSKEIVLIDCAWIADDGRFSDSFEKEYSEVEPFPEGEVIIGRGSIIDASVIKKALPRKQK